MEQTFSDITEGTVEFWISAKQTDHSFNLRISDGGGSTNYLNLMLGDDGHFKHYPGTVSNLPSDTTYSVDTWIHVRIDFDCDGTTYGVYINSEFKGYCLYYGNPTQMDTIRFSSEFTDEGIVYIDAIGYSWDPEYTIGDNLVESCPDDAAIPGYDLLIICGIFSFVLVGLYLKKKKYL